MKGATTATAGTAGLVPAPSKAYNSRFLRGDGIWADPTTSAIEGNIRYNESEDNIEIYYNGAWVDWKYAGLQNVYLIKSGLINETLTGGLDTSIPGNGGTIYPSVTESEGYCNIHFYQDSTNYWQGLVVPFDNGIDVTNYNKLYFTLSASVATSYGTYNNDNSVGLYIKLNTSKPTAWGALSTNTAEKQLLSNAGTTSYSATDYIDIANLSGIQYIFFFARFEFGAKSKPLIDINITNMWFE